MTTNGADIYANFIGVMSNHHIFWPINVIIFNIRMTTNGVTIYAISIGEICQITSGMSMLSFSTLQ